MKIGWFVLAVVMTMLGVVFQVALWSTTGDGSALVVVQGICNVLMGLAYFGIAGFFFWKAAE